MDVNQFLSNLTNLEKTRNFNVFKDYSLSHFQSVLERFIFLENSEPVSRISVVGTNGKGSIAYFLNKLAFSGGIYSKVGLYTSPHLITQNERIQVNGSMISDEWMNEKLNSFSLEELSILKSLSYFEFFTLFAILYFRDHRCDLEIYEAGLGGRLDATKLVNPNIVILTKIGLDHTEVLGNTEEEILLEKLQISGSNTKKVYTFLQEENLIRITQDFCKKNSIEFILFPEKLSSDYLSFNQEFSIFVLNDLQKDKKKKLLDKNLLKHNYNLPARLEVIKDNPLVIFDVAHNPSAVFYLLKSLQSKWQEIIRWQIYFASLKDKNTKEILNILVQTPFVDSIFQIMGDKWSKETISHSKISVISEEEFLKSMSERNRETVILGSFRLYSMVVQNVV